MCTIPLFDFIFMRVQLTTAFVHTYDSTSMLHSSEDFEDLLAARSF